MNHIFCLAKNQDVLLDYKVVKMFLYMLRRNFLDYYYFSQILLLLHVASIT